MKKRHKLDKLWIIILIVCMINNPLLYAKDDDHYIETDSIMYDEETVHFYKHKTSGLNLIWIENDDTNLGFTLGVKTPTTDSTGVNHIIEHTLFTGSEKYPSSTLFFDASAKYPTSFMNALTSADLTLFPFSTPYENCYEQLVDIYLDAIFNPNMLQQPYSFYEESFYYNTETKSYGGVVYNEMKGANAEIGRNIYKAVRKGFYDGTHYANDSGGTIQQIPTLSYEQFVETYKKYYYPNNMLIVLYGDLDISDMLEDIHEYVKNHTLTDQWVDVNVPFCEDTEPLNVTYTSDEEDVAVIKGFLVKEPLSIKDEMMLDLWIQTYWADANSVLREKLKGFGVNSVEVIKDDGTQFPIYAIIAKDIAAFEKEKVSAFIDASWQQTLTQRDLLKESEILERVKFSTKEEVNQGMRAINLADKYISNWAHQQPKNEQSQTEVFNHMDTLELEITQMMEQKVHQRTIYLEPTPEITVSPLIQSPVSKKDWESINKDMITWQQENRSKHLPNIDINQMITDIEFPKHKDKQFGEYLLTINDSDLIQSNIYLDINHIDQSKLFYLFLYAELLNEAAKEYQPFEGKIESSVVSVDQKQGESLSYLNIKIMTTNDKMAPDIYEELIQQLQAKPKEWFLEKLEIYKRYLKQQMQTDLLATLKKLNGGGQTGAKRYQYEKFYPLYENLKKIDHAHMDEFIQKTIDITEELGFNQETLIGLTGSKSAIKEQQEGWEQYIEAHEMALGEYTSYEFTKNQPLNIYYQNTPVDYVLGSYDKEDDWVDGGDYVLAAYATHYYLQPMIRVEKGAYGAGMYAIYPNSLSFYTYRDPDYKTSLKIIQQLSSALKTTISPDMIEAIQVEALSNFQKQLKLLGTSFEKSSTLEQLHIAGVKERELKHLQEDILDADVELLEEKLTLLEYMIPKSQIGICTKKKTITPQISHNIYEIN